MTFRRAGDKAVAGPLADIDFWQRDREVKLVTELEEGCLPRSPFTLAISKDDGKTWAIRRTLESDMTGWYCYVAALELDGDLLLGYSARDNLRHSRVKLVPLDWLCAAKDHVEIVK